MCIFSAVEHQNAGNEVVFYSSANSVPKKLINSFADVEEFI